MWGDIEHILEPRRAALLAAALGVVIHLGVMFNDHAGDSIYIVDVDEGIQSLSNLPTRLLEPSWPGPAGVEMGGWRPIHTGLIALTWGIAGRSPPVFHVVNLMLHATVIVLVVYVLFALFPPMAAAVGGLIFAIHPVHIEVVVDVPGTAEILAAIFGLSAVLLHLRAPKGYGLARALAVTVLYALAVLSKESGAALPLLLFLLDAARTDMTARRTLAYVRSHGPLYLLMAAALMLVLMVRISVLGAVAGTPTPYGMEALKDMTRVWTVMQAWPHYVRLLLFPLDLSIDNTPGIIPVAFAFTPLAITGVLVALMAFSVALWTWRAGEPLDPSRGSVRVIGFAVLWIAAALLPVSNILYVSPVLVAERNLYLPSLGLVAAVGWLVSRVEAKRVHAGTAIVAVLIVAGTVRTVTRIPDWRDNDTLWEELLESHPNSGSGWIAYGERLFKEGRAREGLRAYGVGIGLLGSSTGQVSLGSHLLAMNRLSSARFFLKREWRERPHLYQSPALLSDVTRRLGDFEEAAAAARAATILAPSNPSNHHLLGQAYTALGRHAEAIDAREMALRQSFPSVALEWLYISIDHALLSDTSAALAALDSASVHAVTDEVRSALAAGREALTVER